MSRHRSSVGLVGAFAIVWLALCGCMTFADGAGAEEGTGLIEEFPISTIIRGSLEGMAPGPEGSMWFVQATGYQQPWGLIERMSPDGLLTGIFTTSIRPFYPTSIVSGPDGNMWFTDVAYNREVPDKIGRITPAGAIVEFPIPGPTSLNFVGPSAIAVGPDGNLWFTDLSEGEQGRTFIGRITPAGKITEFPIPTGSQVDLPEHSSPIDIAAGADGNLWFTDQGTDAEGRSLIGRITPAGSIVEFAIPVRGTAPTSIALGAEGNMWFTQTDSNTVGRITTTGEITEYATPGISGALDGITLGPDGNMWFTGTPGIDPIAWITTAGKVRTIPLDLIGSANPSSIVAGPDGDIWFTDPRGYSEIGLSYYSFIGRLVTPYAPENDERPLLIGRARDGQILSVSDGGWADAPSSFVYQWQRCNVSGGNCENIDGGDEAEYVLGADDVGHTLRAIVVAGNIAGETSAVSGISSLVQALPVPSAAPVVISRSPSAPLLGATMTWSFISSRAGAVVRSLVVHGLPSGGTVKIICRGRGCPLSLKSGLLARICRARKCVATPIQAPASELELTRLFKGRRLSPGAGIRVSVVRAGWIGKSFTFAIRRAREPTVQMTCLAPESTSVAHSC